MKRDFRAREAKLAAREAALAETKEAFQGTVQEATAWHQAQEAVAGMKSRQLERLREETSMEVTGLDIYRAKLRATESRIDAKSAKLAKREASSEEAAAKLRGLLVAVIAHERKITDEIAWLERLHESHLADVREVHKADLAAHTEKVKTELSLKLDEVLARKAQEHGAVLSALEKENTALQKQAIRELQGQAKLNERVQKTGELLALRAKEITELKAE